MSLSAPVLATHVRTLGRGPGRSRSLTREEAAEAMALMLRGDAAPEAVGALLMLLRMKGETADEIAGFSAAAQAEMPLLTGVDLDWPSYAAGRTRGAPLFLLAARLVAAAGHRVLLHGWNGPAGSAVRDGLRTAGIPFADTVEAAEAALPKAGITYLALETAHPALFRLLALREVLGLRSCINTVCRMLNPGAAPASVQGVFHPSYRLLQADAAGLLGWRSLSVIKGGGGEFERNPTKDIAAFGLRGGRAWEGTQLARMTGSRKMPTGEGPGLAAVWSGAEGTEFEQQIVLGTAELALATLGRKDPAGLARNLWTRRRASLAA